MSAATTAPTSSLDTTTPEFDLEMRAREAWRLDHDRRETRTWEELTDAERDEWKNAVGGFTATIDATIDTARDTQRRLAATAATRRLTDAERDEYATAGRTINTHMLIRDRFTATDTHATAATA